MKKEDLLRHQLLELLSGGSAHMTFAEAIDEFPLEHINSKAPHMPYSPWHLLEHIRISQWDILEFIRNPDHISPAWPQGYFPVVKEKADESRWRQTIKDFLADLEVIKSMAADQNTDLFAPIPHAKDYTISREILLVADHNAYHIGEFAMLRQIMQTWPSGRVEYDAE